MAGGSKTLGNVDFTAEITCIKLQTLAGQD